MKFFVAAVKCELSQLLSSHRTLALLLIIPLTLAFLGAALPDDELMPAVPVGWTMPEGCERGEELLGLLRAEEGFIEFIEADEETLRANVASGKWECGFILRGDFDDRIARMRTARLFELAVGEDSSLYKLVSEAVSSAMLVMLSEEIGRNYLEDAGAVAPDDGWVLDAERRLEILPAHDGELGLERVSEGMTGGAMRGCAAIMLTVLAVSMGEELSRRRLGGWSRRLAGVRGRALPMLAALFARLVLMLAASYPALALFAAAPLLPLLALCLSLMALTALLSALPDGWGVAVLPFLPPVMLVLCPVLFDTAALVPALAPLCGIFPATHYLRGDVLQNLGICAALSTAALCAHGLQRQ